MKIPKTDLHSHPFLKPYGHSYYENNNPEDACSGASPWMKDQNTGVDDLLENAAGFAPYRQADFTSCKDGNVRMIVNSFYAVEQGFLDTKSEILDKVAGKTLANIITEFGKSWIAEIKSDTYNYYNDLLRQMNYADILQNKVPLNGVSKYRVIRSGDKLLEELKTGDLIVVNSFEGAQALCNGNDPADLLQWNGIEDRIVQIKNHACRPFFVTLAHHFYNGLCSHSESLFDLKDIIRGQELGMGTLREWTSDDGVVHPPLCDREITPIGYKVIELLLTTDNGPSVLIDIKHMSEKARKEFYMYRKEIHPGLPVIYSHGATQKYYPFEINLSENDIREIVSSRGMIGIEIDQRILGYNLSKGRFTKWFKNIFKKDQKQNMMWAKCYWDNLIHIAEVSYAAGLKENPWQYISIGSDFDGIINPLNEFRTIDRLDDLLASLQEYLRLYWSEPNPVIPVNCGGAPSDVVYLIGYKNLVMFTQEHFK